MDANKTRITTLFGLLLVLVLYILIRQLSHRVVFDNHATENQGVTDVIVFNRTTQSFSLFWQTKLPTSSTVLWGTASPNTPIEEGTKSTFHFVTITHLVPDQTYQFKILPSPDIYTVKTRKTTESLGQLLPIVVNPPSDCVDSAKYVFINPVGTTDYLGGKFQAFEEPLFNQANFFDHPPNSNQSFNVSIFGPLVRHTYQQTLHRGSLTSYLPAPVISPTPTITPLPPANQNTDVLVKLKLSGYLGAKCAVSFTVTAKTGTGTTHTTSTQQEEGLGQFVIESEHLPAEYRLTITPKGYLPQTFSCQDCFLGELFDYWFLAEKQGEINLTKSVFIPGDINQDGSVNMVDFGILKDALGTNSDTSDLDGNGLVNGRDYVLWLWGAGNRWETW